MEKTEGLLKSIFVLDTSVIIYDHNAITQFDDNDVAIPITVLEELDDFKKGNDTKNFTAREFIRFLDKLANKKDTLQEWIPLKGNNKGSFKILMNGKNGIDANEVFGEVKADHKILNTVLALKSEYLDRRIILVSKDINLRLKAKSLSIAAEDYETGKIQNIETINRGNETKEGVNISVINSIYRDGSCKPKDAGLKISQSNAYYILKNDKKSALVHNNPQTGLLDRVEKVGASGVTPLNAEQVFALHAIMNLRLSL